MCAASNYRSPQWANDLFLQIKIGPGLQYADVAGRHIYFHYESTFVRTGNYSA